jgi:cytochrome c
MKLRIAIAAAALVALTGGTAGAGQRATPAEAEAMVRKAAAFLAQNGPDKAYKAISDRKGRFVDRDLYIVAYSLDGTCLAHGANDRMIGKNLSEVRDVDGKFYVRERVDLARTKQSFWHDYKFTNPVTKKIEPKQMYCEKVGDTLVCGGVYKS